MGGNKRPIIIEFNGLPGSGKTTISDHLFDSIEKNKYNVIKLENIIKKLKNGKKTNYLKLFKYGGIKLPLNLLFFFLSIKPFKIYRFAFVKSVYLYFLVYRKCIEESEYDAIIVDQGIIQALISSYHLDKMVNVRFLKKIINSLIKDKSNYLFVDCISNERISSKRIIERKLYTRRRFDSMNKELLIKNLNIQKGMFKEIRSHLNFAGIERINLDMVYYSKQNSDILFSEFQNRLLTNK